MSRSTRRPDQAPPAHLTRELEREYRAVVEEILEHRGDDGRISGFLRSITSPGALADTSGYSPDISVAQKIQLLETLDVVERLKLALRLQQERLTELVVRKRIREDVEGGAQKQQREYFLRKQMDSIRKELGEDDASASVDYRREDCFGGHAGGGPATGRARAVTAGAGRRLERRVGNHPDVSRLAPRRSVVQAFRGAARSALRARSPRRRPRGPGRGEEAHHRVPGGPQAAHRARHGGYAAVGGHAHADWTAGNRQDVDWRVDREGDRTAVRPHVARRASRRGGDPWASPHLHRRAARAAGACAARRRHDEPGDHARRGRQDRIRLARRSVGGAARGARPGAEPLVPRPLPGRRARSVARAVHRDRQRGRYHPRSAAGPHGSDPVRRLHDRREGCDCARASVAAPDRAERPAHGRSRR